jgi:hypothetical protein
MNRSSDGWRRGPLREKGIRQGGFLFNCQVPKQRPCISERFFDEWIAANLIGLTALDLYNNPLTSFTLPAGLPNLTLLDLGLNSLTQCSIPAGMTTVSR